MALETLTKLATVTVDSGGQASIEFLNIPQTYTDLVIKASLRSTNASVNPGLLININGNNTGLSTRLLYGDGSAAASYTATDEIGTPAGDNATASTFGNAEIYFPNYAGSTNKSFFVDTVNENNATSATQYLTAGLRSNTAAITSILLKPSSAANFKQHSTATLYGVKAQRLVAKATGGDSVKFDGTYWIHTFTSSGTFTSTQSMPVEYLFVAGGGSTYYDGLTDRAWSGGGGAGGYRTSLNGGAPLFLATGIPYAVTVGAGGSRGTTPTKGSNSSITGGTLTFSSTGGAQGPAGNGAPGLIGGSGSGGSGQVTTGSAAGAGNEGGYSPVEGYAGGAGGNGASNTYGGGGGGSAGVGASGQGVNGAAGGAGTSNSITGTAVTYAAGGNGGNANSGAFVSGSSNTGNGAGYGGNGGSGIVVIRYKA